MAPQHHSRPFSQSWASLFDPSISLIFPSNGRLIMQTTKVCILLLFSSLGPPLVSSLGYLRTPRSRNFVAYEDTVWWPKTETDPEPETTPQGLDRGGVLAQCGMVEALRNYDLPQNILGDLMPINVQAVYDQEDEINIEISLISSNGGHFQFSMCPIEWGEVPTEDCFKAHPLEFVKDNFYGATFDPNYPERIYIPDGDVVGRVDDETGFTGNKMLFSYQMNLPCGLTGDLVLLQWYFVTAQDCYHDGYLEYDFPDAWGPVFDETFEKCPSPLPPDGNGLPLQYWNCAEVEIRNTGSTDRCAPTMSPSLSPTPNPTSRPTKRPTRRPTKRPTQSPIQEPTLSPVFFPTISPTDNPVISLPFGSCEDLCFIPIDPEDCSSIPSLETLPPCLSSDSRTVSVGDYCEGSGECDTSNKLNNCRPGRYDVYQRTQSCANDDEGITPEDTPISIPVLDNDNDGSGLGLSIVEWSLPNDGTVTLEEGELVYTPNPDYNGPDQFSYVTIDGDGFIDTAVVDITVIPVNDRPDAQDDFAATPEGTNVRIPVLQNDSDPDDSLSIDSVTQPENGVSGIRPDGTVIYRPDPGFVGEDTFTYKVCDRFDECDEATVTVDVIPPDNERPVAEDDSVTIPQGTDEGTEIPVLENDSDPDGDPLTVDSVTEPDHGTTNVTPDGQNVIYTPEPGFIGQDTFEYTVCDTGDLCSTAQVSVTVDPIDNKPPGTDVQESTTPNKPIIVDVTNKDDNDKPLVVVDVTEPENGICVIVGDSYIEYTPDDGFTGRDSCDYIVCDSDQNCDEGTLIVDVVDEPTQRPPLAVDDIVTTPEDQPVTVDPLDNDRNPSGSPLTVIDVTQPEHGKCEITDNGDVIYTPDAGYTGRDECEYFICDAIDLCDEGTIIIIVLEPSNTSPLASEDSAVIPINTQVSINVLENDVDVDGDNLSLVSVTEPTNGDVRINPDGSITYTPAADFVGTDSFNYSISDGRGGSDTTTVYVDVVGPGGPSAPSPMKSWTIQPTSRPNKSSIHPFSSSPMFIPSRAPDRNPSFFSETCDDLCFKPIDNIDCPVCDPSTLPSCWDGSRSVPHGELCEAEGECGLSNELNNCEGSWDIYRRVPCFTAAPTPAVPTSKPTPAPTPQKVAPAPNVCMLREGESMTFSASDDAYISEKDRLKNFNTNVIVIDDSPKLDGIIRWELSDDLCECVTIDKVFLRLYVLDPSPGGGFVHATNPNWDEEAINWENSPDSSGPPLAVLGRVANETWVEIDVTGFVSTIDKHVALRIESCVKNRVQYASKEFRGGQYGPQLVFKFGLPSMGVHLLSAHDDASILENNPIANFGSDHYLKISDKNREVYDSMLRFDISCIMRQGYDIGSAALRLYSSESSPSGGSIYAVYGGDSLSWNENSVTWESASQLVFFSESQLGDIGAITLGNSYEVDATEALVNSQGQGLTFRITSGGKKSGSYCSKENPECAGPQLVLSSSAVVKIDAIDDSTIQYQNEDENYGSGSTLEVDPSSCRNTHTLIRFDVGSLPEDPLIEYAAVLVYVSEGSSLSGATFVNTKATDWTEDSVTWRNAPEADGKVLGTLNSLRTGMWYEIDVTTIITTADYLSIRVVPLATANASCEDSHFAFSSKENSNGNGPQLVVIPESQLSPSDPIPPSKPRREYFACESGNKLPAGEIAIIPTDDTFISEEFKENNYGRDPALLVDLDSGIMSVLLKFDLSCLGPGTVTSAMLNIFSIDGSPQGGKFTSIPDDGFQSWDEDTVTWETAPLHEGVDLFELGRVKIGTWHTVNVTGAIPGGDIMTIRIEPLSTNRVSYSSKENNIGNPPYLSIIHTGYQTTDIRQSPPPSELITFNPQEDATIKEAVGNRNFNDLWTLTARYGVGSRIDALLKFSFDNSFEGPIYSAILKLYCLNSSPRGGKIVSVSGDWGEDKVTWDNAPVVTSGFVSDIGKVVENSWVEIDVTSSMTGNNELTFRIEGVNENGASYCSRKNTSRCAPVLEVRF